MVHVLSKKCCADFGKISKSIKATYIYASERSRDALSENGIVYYAMVTVLEILGFAVEEFC